MADPTVARDPLAQGLRRLGTSNATAKFEETVKEVSEQVLYAGLRASTPPTEKQVLTAERVGRL
jgi:hypothetical protein